MLFRGICQKNTLEFVHVKSHTNGVSPHVAGNNLADIAATSMLVEYGGLLPFMWPAHASQRSGTIIELIQPIPSTILNNMFLATSADPNTL